MNFKKSIVFSLIFSILFSLSASEPRLYYTQEKISYSILARASENEKTVIPGGKCVGVTLCCDGVLVVSTSDVTTKDGSYSSPAKDAGIKSGDLIKSLNHTDITCVEDLNSAISASNGKKVPISLRRNGKKIESLVEPKFSNKDNVYRIGAWVKDSASGIGTITFYDPQNQKFAALGHGICDSETGSLIDIGSGNIFTSSIVSVDKGEKGIPGELNGIFTDNHEAIGKITKNCEYGIFGDTISKFPLTGQPVPVASRDEVTTGAAYILSNTEGNKVEKFNIEIIKILPKGMPSQKGMIIKVVDEKLLSKTGGIVQGMSGCPIIQNDKLVGAVTHVFVNDPTKGYGIFIENMLSETEK